MHAMQRTAATHLLGVGILLALIGQGLVSNVMQWRRVALQSHLSTAAYHATSNGYLSVKFMHRLFIAICAAACLSLLGCSDIPEASFELAHESRLPKWFTLPPGLSRSDVTVTMDYYLKHTTFKLLDAKKQKLAEVNGKNKSLEPLMRKIPQPGFPTGYPSYEIITVNGITEVIEHRRMEPVFYITDDPAVLAELGLIQSKK